MTRVTAELAGCFSADLRIHFSFEPQTCEMALAQPATTTLSSQPMADQSRSGSEPEIKRKGLQWNLTVAKDWLTMNKDMKIATCADIREKALVGIGELEVFDPRRPRLRLGGRNPRRIKTNAVKRIGNDIYNDAGPRRLTPDMAIHLVVRRSWIQTQAWPRQITHQNYQSLPPVVFSDAGQEAASSNQIHVINGQHRIAGLRRAYETAETKLEQLEQAIERQGEEEEEEAKAAELQRLRRDELDKLEKLKTWPCNIWDLDVIEAEETGNLLIDLLSQNKDTVEINATEEDRLAPLYQQLLGLQRKDGWRPELWRSVACQQGVGGHQSRLEELINKQDMVRKFGTIVMDHRTTRGMMEMTRIGRYYRDWSGFTVNHISTRTVKMTSSYLWTYIQAQNELLGLVFCNSTSDANFPYEKFQTILAKHAKAKSPAIRETHKKQLEELAVEFITTFIDQVESMPDLEEYYTMEFWKGVEKAEVDSGLALPGGKKKKHLYADDVFQVATLTQQAKYSNYIKEVRKGIEKILSHAKDLLDPHVKLAALSRFDILFSGHLYNIRMVLMSTPLLDKFEDICGQYMECFREIHAWVDPISAYLLEWPKDDPADRSYVLFDSFKRDILLTNHHHIELVFAMHVVCNMLPHFSNWIIEMERSPEYIFLPQLETARLPKGFWQQVNVYGAAQGKGKGKKGARDNSDAVPPIPPNYTNGIFASGRLALTWQMECQHFRTCQDVFRTWNVNEEPKALRHASRSVKDILHRAMSVYSSITVFDGKSNNLQRISSKWRIAMLMLLVHDAKCRRPLMRSHGISAFLYTSLVNAVRSSAIDPKEFDLVSSHQKNAASDRYVYLDDPTLFVRRLQGLPDESETEDEDGESPLAQYNLRRRQHQSDIQVLRDTFKNMPWIHSHERISAPLDCGLIEAWNDFETALRRYSIVSSLNAVITDEEKYGTTIPTALHDEDIHVTEWIKPSKFEYKPNVYKGSTLRSDHSAPLPKFLWNHKDFDFIAPGGDSAGGDSAGGDSNNGDGESSNGGGKGGGESDNKSSESDNEGHKNAPDKGKQHIVQDVSPSDLKSQPAPQGDEDESSSLSDGEDWLLSRKHPCEPGESLPTSPTRVPAKRARAADTLAVPSRQSNRLQNRSSTPVVSQSSTNPNPRTGNLIANTSGLKKLGH
ncbi:uncharacterized protein EI90DRAFT_3089466 [Cantharellus anzutake]|uniref:uncharacterized protein n=1 Tax=Cantharellus anzutake TaxID=1750568 RepID=UPI0019064B31|nr:uncharacterized protein EI90DRAFT_3089466 [Cantharellus anzutake]KAF8314833.1 hypothetical protein EI90DRAFT_3089466 [Cantharellus anzutake]